MSKKPEILLKVEYEDWNTNSWFPREPWIRDFDDVPYGGIYRYKGAYFLKIISGEYEGQLQLREEFETLYEKSDNSGEVIPSQWMQVEYFGVLQVGSKP